MTTDFSEFVSPSCEVLALGEPTHQEPAFGRVRNQILADLVEWGFGSIALESDRVAALAVNDFVQRGIGNLDDVMRDGFSHGFGALAPNRELVAWLREYNRERPAYERLSFHGFDAPMENFSAPSPRRYLAYAADYLGIGVDLVQLAGDDQRWNSAEAVLDPAKSPGATADAERLSVIADELMTRLYARAPELIAATSRESWVEVRTTLAAGRDLLRYHRQCAQPGDPGSRMARLIAGRDSLMAQNLLEIRQLEAKRGPTLVFAHNLHLQRQASSWTKSETAADTDVAWYGAGSVAASLLGDSYRVIAGSLGRSATMGLGDPAPGTFESRLQPMANPWALLPVRAVTGDLTKRGDAMPEMGYFPLSPETLAGVDGVLHIREGHTAPENPS